MYKYPGKYSYSYAYSDSLTEDQPTVGKRKNTNRRQVTCHANRSHNMAYD